MSRRKRGIDQDLVQLAARRLGLQSAGLVALAVVTLLALGALLFVRQEDAAARDLLRQATRSADDVGDPPAGAWLAIRGSGRMQTTGGLPKAFPDVATMTKVGRTGTVVMGDVHVGSAEYLVRTARLTDGVVVQAVLDLGPQHRQRARLTKVLLTVAGIGLVFSGLVGTLMARRTVRPLSEALSLQRSFIADASHELRTPLTLLSTRAQLLRRSLASRGAEPSVLQDADGVIADTRRLADVVEELLAVADPWAKAPTGPVDLVALCAELIASAQAHATSQEVTLLLEPPVVGATVRVTGDATALHRAVLALVDNAIEHTPPTGTVTVSVRRDDRNVSVLVSDAGPGIAPADVDRVFDRFHSGRQKANRRSYGLGLALARAVVSRHGGTLTVERTSASGTTFALTLPSS